MIYNSVLKKETLSFLFKDTLLLEKINTGNNFAKSD